MPNKSKKKQKVGKAVVVVTARQPVRKNKQKKQRKPVKSGSGETLSPCAVDYAMAIKDPFDGPLACVPSAYPPIPSFKARVWAKGTASVGTTGTGYVLLRPSAMAANDTTNGAVWSSGVTYAQNAFPTAVGDVGNVTQQSNAMWTSAQIVDTPQGIQFRRVGFGIRVWYIGTELNLSGQMFALRHPDNDSILALTLAQTMNFSSTRRVAVDSTRQTLDITWVPMKPGEVEFNHQTVTDAYNMGIIFTGVASTANNFAYEAYAVFEYVGATVPNRTQSHADPAGFAAVLTAAQNEGDSWYGNARDAGISIIKSATQGLRDLSGSHFVRGAVKQAASAYFSHALGLPSLSILPQADDRGITELSAHHKHTGKEEPKKFSAEEVQQIVDLYKNNRPQDVPKTVIVDPAFVGAGDPRSSQGYNQARRPDEPGDLRGHSAYYPSRDH